jgi:hypothetical protein
MKPMPMIIVLVLSFFSVQVLQGCKGSNKVYQLTVTFPNPVEASKGATKTLWIYSIIPGGDNATCQDLMSGVHKPEDEGYPVEYKKWVPSPFTGELPTLRINDTKTRLFFIEGEDTGDQPILRGCNTIGSGAQDIAVTLAIVCPSGKADCDEDFSTGCEEDITTTAKCGNCTTACTNDHGDTACSSSVCAPTCDSGFSDCDGNPDNGCERDITTTAACGTCTNACSSDNCETDCTSGVCAPTCVAGQCHCRSFYISPDGSDTNLGTPDSPWLTFVYSLPKLRPGDVLVLMDGEYTKLTTGFPNIYCASVGGNAVNGTADRPITIMAQHERQAHLNSDGSYFNFLMQYCSYWNIEGLYGTNADLPYNLGGSQYDCFLFQYDDHLNIKRLLASHTNRYGNTHTIAINFSSYILVEESESYYYHRWGLIAFESNNITFRRNYVHSRNTGVLRCDGSDGGAGYCNDSWNVGSSSSILPGYACTERSSQNCLTVGECWDSINGACHTCQSGDVCGYHDGLDDYPLGEFGQGFYGTTSDSSTYDSIIENGISEDNVSGISTGSIQQPVNHKNQFLGVMTLNNTSYGITAGAESTPGNGSDITNAVSVQDGLCVEDAGGSNNVYTNTTCLSSIHSGNKSYNGDTKLARGIFFTNSLVYLPAWNIAFDIATGANVTYSIDYPNYTASVLPSDLVVTNHNTETPTLIGIAPNTCAVYVPGGNGGANPKIDGKSSNMAGAGLNGEDIGANIVYRYQDGVLTNQKLWDQTTGQFPCGAIVPGMNDVEGSSCFDVHKRLNVGVNGCPIP